METVETTKKDFKVFKREFQKWMKFFGLTNWRVCFLHAEIVETSLATIKYDLDGYIATCTLSTQWPKAEYSKRLIRQTAFHECAHLLIARLNSLAQSRYVNKAELEESEHELVRILENTVFETCQ